MAVDSIAPPKQPQKLPWWHAAHTSLEVIRGGESRWLSRQCWMGAVTELAASTTSGRLGVTPTRPAQTRHNTILIEVWVLKSSSYHTRICTAHVKSKSICVHVDITRHKGVGISFENTTTTLRIVQQIYWARDALEKHTTTATRRKVRAPHAQRDKLDYGRRDQTKQHP